MNGEWKHKFWECSGSGFEEMAIALFHHQYAHNALYRRYTDALHIRPEQVTRLESIPFLPISFFKTHRVQTGDFREEAVFESSGTTGMSSSRHYVQSRQQYEDSFNHGFRLFYGEPSRYCIIGLLPSYLERGHSSLVYMTDHLIRQSRHPDSGFYLNQYEALATKLQHCEAQGQPVILIGVTYALLEFAAAFPMSLKNTTVMETGGMKGRRRELTRAEVHAALQSAWGIEQVHSEYGMTELLSQAYSKGAGLFQCPPWMRVLIREEEDPLAIASGSGRGLINVIDLANSHSCAFIATDDAGILHPDQRFEIIGRRDGSDLRGCSLLAL